jgi:hypothetical protein
MNYTLHMTNGDDLFHKEFSADEFCKCACMLCLLMHDCSGSPLNSSHCKHLPVNTILRFLFYNPLSSIVLCNAKIVIYTYEYVETKCLDVHILV